MPLVLETYVIVPFNRAEHTFVIIKGVIVIMTARIGVIRLSVDRTCGERLHIFYFQNLYLRSNIFLLHWFLCLQGYFTATFLLFTRYIPAGKLTFCVSPAATPRRFTATPLMS